MCYYALDRVVAEKEGRICCMMSKWTNFSPLPTPLYEELDTVHALKRLNSMLTYPDTKPVVAPFSLFPCNMH